MENEEGKKERDQKIIPLEKDDFYLNEQGLMVFTSKYLLKRGYCCKNKCRHCPYPQSN